ncbi:unnamed protein product [Victoria cruziana]
MEVVVPLFPCDDTRRHPLFDGDFSDNFLAYLPFRSCTSTEVGVAPERGRTQAGEEAVFPPFAQKENEEEGRLPEVQPTEEEATDRQCMQQPDHRRRNFLPSSIVARGTMLLRHARGTSSLGGGEDMAGRLKEKGDP